MDTFEQAHYSKYDSWAFWPGTAELTPEMPLKAVEATLKKAYTLGFPSEIDQTALTAKLPAVQYVFIGLNPGTSGPAAGQFGNFHGIARSGITRLAAVAYGTEAWGAFMTDLVTTEDSHASNIHIKKPDVDAFLTHLEELGIPESATLIALGGQTFRALQRFLPANRHLETMMHYSGANGYWKPAVEHQKLLAIIARHDQQ